MRKFILFLLLLLAAAAAVFWSCSKDAGPVLPEERANDRFSIKSARTFFEGFQQPIRLFGTDSRSGSVEGLAPEVYPLWQQSRIFDFRGFDLVEVPLSIDRGSAHRWSEGTALPDSLNYANTVFRLLSLEYEGEILYSVAFYIADKCWLDSLPGVIDDMSLRDMEDFTGTIQYYTVGGEFLGGVVCDRGFTKLSVEPASGAPEQEWPLLLKAQTRALNCWVTIERWTYCWHTGYYDGNDTWHETHVECFPGTVDYMFCETTTEAYYKGGGSGGGIAGDRTPIKPSVPPLDPTSECDSESRNANANAAGLLTMLRNTKSDTIIGNTHYVSYSAYLASVTANTSIENATSLYNYNGLKLLTPVVRGTSTSVEIEYTSSSVVASIHNHPNGTPPSAADAMTTGLIAGERSGYTTTYVYNHSSGTYYALQVTDRAKAADFYDNYRSQVDPATNWFYPNSEIGIYLDGQRDAFRYLSDSERQSFQLAAILSKFNAGMKLVKQTSDGRTESYGSKQQAGQQYITPTKCKQ